jgi:hypothetical protein
MTPEQEALIRKLDNQYAPGSEYVARNTIAGLRRLMLTEIDTLRAQKAELLEACKIAELVIADEIEWLKEVKPDYAAVRGRALILRNQQDAIARTKAGEKGASE